jgi:hypothetical protein
MGAEASPCPRRWRPGHHPGVRPLAVCLGGSSARSSRCLGLAPDGRLVVAELKRGPAPHTIHMQAINYAAMVSRLTARDIAELYAQDREKSGVAVDVDAALAEFEADFLLNDESIGNPRIVLIASEFPTSVTASVVWLNERAVDVSLVRYRAYSLATGQIVVTFSRFFPVPTAEDFTVGRFRAGDTGAEAAPAIPWDQPALQRVAQRGNAATLALLDLCASSDDPVSVRDIQVHASLTPGQVRGQLAGFTMLLRNKWNGFEQSSSPWQITWLPGGVASYSMPQELKSVWQAVRNSPPTTAPSAPEVCVDGIPSADDQPPTIDGAATDCQPAE